MRYDLYVSMQYLYISYTVCLGRMIYFNHIYIMHIYIYTYVSTIYETLPCFNMCAEEVQVRDYSSKVPKTRPKTWCLLRDARQLWS